MSLVRLSKAMTPVAKRVYDDMMALPDDAAVLYAQIVVGGAMADDIEMHRDMIQKRVEDIIKVRVETIKKGLSRSFIAKARDGQDTSVIEAVYGVISKDEPFFNFTDAQRREYVRHQDRGPDGRFRQQKRSIDYSRANHKIPRAVARQLGIPTTGAVNLDKTDLINYQHAYLQVADMLRGFKDYPDGSGTLHLTYQLPSGHLKTVTSALTSDPGLEPAKFLQKGKLVEASVITDSGHSGVPGAAFDLVGALGGSPYMAGRVSRVYAGQNEETHRFASADRLGNFADQWNSQIEEDVANPSNRVFRRLSNGSQLIQEMAGENIPNKVKLALKTAEFVGQHEPEAAKVIGPHADRAAYRYRGVERKPDPTLQQNIEGFRARFGDEGGREALIYGGTSQVATRTGVRTETVPSPLIAYFAGKRDPSSGKTRGGKLPDADLAELQRKSGVIPPSEGIIIDRKGKVITQAVGYGDDWYLPFNLKTLSKLKGGEYIRTRTWGGPTTEDIYAGLVSGARAVTVISHNGVYTIEFDDSFRGSRRYNDKAARMVKRYGHLLDAVKSKEVTLSGIPHEREDELKAEAAGEFDPKLEREKYEEYLGRLKREEKRDPQMPEKLRQAAAAEFVEEHLQPSTTTGEHLDWTQIAELNADHRVEEMRQMRNTFSPGAPFDADTARSTALRALDSPEKLVDYLGRSHELTRYMERAETKYKASQSPLNLDGAGYEASMDALREQFPYYIKRTKWQELHRGGFDGGYVKPKYTRPEAALAGYFDPSISGYGSVKDVKGNRTGKVTADTTRYQNPAAVAQVVAHNKERQEARDAANGVPLALGAASRSGGMAANMRKVDNLMALYDAVNKPDRLISGGAHVGKPLAAGKASMRPFAPTLLGDKDALQRMASANPAEATAAVLKDVEALQSHGWVNFDEVSGLKPLLDNVKDPEAADRGVRFKAEDAMKNPDQKFDFGEAFSHKRKPEQLEAKAKDILLALGMKKEDFDSPDLEKQMNDIIRDQYNKVMAADRGGVAISPTKVEARVRQACQVKALIYAHQKAKQREEEAANFRHQQEQDRVGRAMPRNSVQEVSNLEQVRQSREALDRIEALLRGENPPDNSQPAIT
jgi:hypothetical protein